MLLNAYIYLSSVLYSSNDPGHVATFLFLILDRTMVSHAKGVVNEPMDFLGF